MNTNQKKELCLALMRADSKAEVVRILTDARLWENRRVWRIYGDRENNFSTIGNQQNRADAALVEKLVNSVDARLMHECLARGINPESKSAPQNIREAVARFFEEGTPSTSIYGGQISAWDNEKRREVARGITLAATGMKVQDGDPCITMPTLAKDRRRADFLARSFLWKSPTSSAFPLFRENSTWAAQVFWSFAGRKTFN
jgi:hypothetical protein